MIIKELTVEERDALSLLLTDYFPVLLKLINRSKQDATNKLLSLNADNTTRVINEKCRIEGIDKVLIDLKQLRNEMLNNKQKEG